MSDKKEPVIDTYADSKKLREKVTATIQRNATRKEKPHFHGVDAPDPRDKKVAQVQSEKDKAHEILKARRKENVRADLQRKTEKADPMKYFSSKDNGRSR